MKTKEINLRFVRESGYDCPTIQIPERMQVSGLLKMIEAKELAEYDYWLGKRETYRKSGKLEDKKEYIVIPRDLDKSLEAIRNYNNLK